MTYCIGKIRKFCWSLLNGKRMESRHNPEPPHPRLVRLFARRVIFRPNTLACLIGLVNAHQEINDSLRVFKRQGSGVHFCCKPKSVRALLSDKYALDFYQREYEWKRENIEGIIQRS